MIYVLLIVIIIALWMIAIIKINRKVPFPKPEPKDTYVPITSDFVGDDEEDRCKLERYKRAGVNVFVEDGCRAYVSVGNGVMYYVANVHKTKDNNPSNLWGGR